MECSLDSAGCLVLEWTYREYGLMLFIVPFVDACSGRAVLEPARQRLADDVDFAELRFPPPPSLGTIWPA